jgi:probable rRNA maturation factor
LGVILFAPNYIYEQCKSEGTDFGEKLEVLLVHSICHLLGYDHINDADYRVMRRKESQLLKHLRISQTPNKAS